MTKYIALFLFCLGYIGAGVAWGQNPPVTAPYCYGVLYNANGTAKGPATWQPCDSNASLWMFNSGSSSKAITPANGVTFAPTRYIYVNGASCTLVTKLVGDTATTTWSNFPASQLVPLRVIDVESTGTTCTGIVGVY